MVIAKRERRRVLLIVISRDSLKDRERSNLDPCYSEIAADRPEKESIVSGNASRRKSPPDAFLSSVPPEHDRFYITID